MHLQHVWLRAEFVSTGHVNKKFIFSIFLCFFFIIIYFVEVLDLYVSFNLM
jgi:hypothetical protein